MKHIKTGPHTTSTAVTPEQMRTILFGSYLMRCLLQAGKDTRTLEAAEIRARGHCLLAASALVDVFHALGRTDAVLHRSGLDLSMYRHGSLVISTTIGHPSAPANSPLWNAHATAGLGAVLFDSTFGRLQADWNSVPLFTSFVRDPNRSTFDLYGYGEVEAIASSCWQTGDRSYAARLFRLPRKVDLATRKWRGRPDAMPERRAELVRRTLELVNRPLEVRVSA
jgi:hypothetical protein